MWLMLRDTSAGCCSTPPSAAVMPTRPMPVKITPRIGSRRPLATAITSAANPNTGTA